VAPATGATKTSASKPKSSASFWPSTLHWALGTGHWALGTGHWALGTLQSGDLCLILFDQVEEALAHIAKRVAEG
jgi:hypothetical protein